MRLKPKYKKPEIVSPAGNWCALKTALESGADAVYFGVKSFNMRHEAENFDILEIKKVMEFLKERGKRGYLALNSIVYNKEIKKIKDVLKKAAEGLVDAVILWDMAVLYEAKEFSLPVHLSTQASVSNFSALKFYASLGVKRVVLARECSLSDIRDIVRGIEKEKINCEVECFIHSALCMSISGRCLISHFSDSKPANRGECLQPCRREYLITDVNSKEKQYIIGKDYILSPKDLCSVNFIDSLIESGISAFKIEGRVRSPEYVKEVTSVYREAVDAYFEKKLTIALKKSLKKRLTAVYNRGFDNGFFFGAPSDIGSKAGKSSARKIFLGDIVNFYSRKKVAIVKVRNDSISVGQEITVYGKSTPVRKTKITDIEINHKPVDKAKKGDTAAIKILFRVRPKDKVFIYKK